MNIENGYWVCNLNLIVFLVGFLLAIPIVGWFVIGLRSKPFARIAAWILVVTSVVFVEQVSIGEPAGTRMLLIIIALLWSMKSVVVVESEETLVLSRWLFFCTAWFGMRPSVFSTDKRRPYGSLDSKIYFTKGLIRVFLGVVLFAAAYMIRILAEGPVIITTVVLCAGLSFVVHFGLFNLLVGFWRFMGFRCNSLFNAPLLSTTLAEFWGRRWNLAFSEMTTLAVFRPLKKFAAGGSSSRWYAVPLATVVAFAFSGLLHELAISVPVRAGFGWPTLYFLLHGFAMVVEVQLRRVGFDLSKNQLVGRIWTACWLFLPLPFLFHRPFVFGCILPLVGG